MTYSAELANKKFRGNVVIRFLGQYFAVRLPDSGVVISSPYDTMVKSLVINPTQVDLKRINQTISSYSFRIIDKQNVLTAMVKDRADALLNQEVEIWIGRSTGSFDFADYFKLPITRIKKIDHADNTYNFSTTEATDRMNKPIFNLQNKLAGSILSGTTTLTLVEDITSWPSTGTGKFDNEFFSWTSKNNTNKQLLGCTRGEKTTLPVAHDAGTQVYWVYDITDNPLDILLKILISGGGGGTYDTYPSGLGISNTLIDISAIEDFRDNIFATEQFSFSMYKIENALKFLEDEILLPCNLRFVTSENSKISVALLDQAVFGEAPDTIDESTIASYPKWEVDDNKIINVIEYEWDFSESTGIYQKVSRYTNADSITNYGERTPYKVKSKGIQASLSGQLIVDDRADRFLTRFGTPNPEISFKTHIDKSLYTVGQKVLLTSQEIPAISGTLQFATELEVISRAINHETGDVNFRLAFTSYSGIRGCYIAPSDLILTVVDQKTVVVPAGRGDCYTVGWNMLLFDESTNSYTADAINTIVSIVGDTITFQNNFTTTLIASQHRLKFVDYDDATQDQRRYCYISDSGLDFNDGSSTYRVTF